MNEMAARDPIPELAERFKKYSLFTKMVLIAGIIAAAAAPFWILKLYAVFFTIQIIGNSFLKSIKKHAYLESPLDFMFSLLINIVKLAILFNILWGLYIFTFEKIHIYTVLVGIAERFLYIDEYILAPPINPIQAAFIIPLIQPIMNIFNIYRDHRSITRDIYSSAEVKISKLLQKAEKYDAIGRNKDAASYYKDALDIMENIIAKTISPEIRHNRSLRRNEIESNLKRCGGDTRRYSAKSEMLNFSPNIKENEYLPKIKKTDITDESYSNSKNNDMASESRNDYVKSLIQKSEISWEHIVGLDELIQDIKLLFGLSLAKGPKGVNIDQGGSILLYGPPGTGKTLIAAAASNEIEATFFNVQVSNVLSKFFGESTKFLSDIFEAARSMQPSVIFFDEIESICPGRDNAGVQGEEKRLISTFLAEMDGMKQKSKKTPVFIFAATNLPWQIDPAIMSRFERSFYIPNPDIEARKKIIELNLTRKGFELEMPIHKIAAHTNGYSGREIAQLCKEMSRMMLQRANPDLNAMVQKGRQAVEQYKLKAIPISAQEINKALSRIKPKTTDDMLDKYENFEQNKTI